MGMKRPETSSNETSTRQNHAGRLAKVYDGRNQRKRGLWVRDGRYYAQMTVTDPDTGKKKVTRIPLKTLEGTPVSTVAEAVAAQKHEETNRAKNVQTFGRKPKFADYAAQYLKDIAAGQGAKAPATVEKEKTILNRWIAHFGEARLDGIKRVHVHSFIRQRQKDNVSNRTINLDVIGLRCVLKDAINAGHIEALPMQGMKPLDEKHEKRPLFTAAMLDNLCEAAFTTKKDSEGKDVPLTQNAQEFVDYLRLMAYSGARRNEALGIKWDDVDFDRGILHLRRQVTRRGIESLKNGEERTVDLNAKLRAHLDDMATRLAPDSEWLFPSPQRGDKDIPAKTFRESLDLVRTKAGMPKFGFHDLRHHFVSMCVMSGIDFMTIASWVGHKDGGILIGKVYGHLANEHRKAMAEKLNFRPEIVPAEKGATA